MSRSVIRPLSIGATAPESLSVLQQRLLVAEEQTEELVRDMGTLGVSREQLRISNHPQSPGGGLGMRPLSPVRVQQVLGAGGEGTLWRQCEALVGRVCRLESLIHTVKLTLFRLETERELNPSHIVRLQEQLAAVQEQCEEEQRSSQREVMRLREQLETACQEREEARQEAHTLRQQLDHSNRSKVDVAVAAEELKMVKDQMSQRLQQVREELEEEKTSRLEAEQSHSALLQRVEEMEGVVEREREQVKLLQADCHALRADGQETRAELQEKDELTGRLQKECEQLRDQSEGKDTLISELSTELMSVRVALQKQQQENCRLVKDGEELRTVADKVQALNYQLEAQCSDLSSALRSLTTENARLQTTLQMEQERVAERLKDQDLLLDAAKRNIQAELQGALSDRLLLKKELDTLRADHSKLQQSSAAALDMAAAHQDLLDRTIERLRGEVSSAAAERENLQRERDEAKTEMSVLVSNLEKERIPLESQISDLQVELCEMSSTLQNVEEENRGLRGRLAAVQHQQYSQQQVEQMLRELMDSRNKLTYEKGNLQIEVQQLREELQVQGAEHKKHQTNSLLGSKYTQDAVLQEALDADPLDSRKLSTPSTMDKLNKREAELLEARAEIVRLVEEMDTMKLQLRKDRHCRGRSAQPDVAKLKTALEEASARSGDLSRANQELGEKVSELEKLVSYQKSRIKAQKAQLKQHMDNRAALSGSKTLKEAEIQSLELSKSEYERKCYEQSQSLLQMRSEMAKLQAELQSLSSIQQGELQAERSLTQTLQEKCQSLEKCVERLREERDETDLKMRAVSQDSLQIAENLQEAHCWFRSKFSSLNSETEQNCAEPEDHPKSTANSIDSIPASPAAVDMDRMSSNRTSYSSVLMCVAEPELERWASTLQRWETKKELARIASGYKQTGRAHSLT
ncbi:coiled-coil domain-containing protein 150 isoform X1 [Astyanax mexicanus]|uniref:coiled-coil domain-containing protein 150 isoform X1 n=1 Tax=Astyanax mexicanus TaxID=7994 RepID=UPI0020CAD6D9|nr:coiled-coil domain-containing protein 150 isoform X1 [Astyanax mexicanus]XP_007231078.3 coiled-coil domain-containing protein 150 isoform X1 [Astyanax mexicanus]